MTLVDGDCDTHDLGSGFDLIFLSAIVHSHPSQGNRDLIRKADAALNASGQLVVRGFILSEERTGSPFGILFALNMLVGTDGGRYVYGVRGPWVKARGRPRLRYHVEHAVRDQHDRGPSACRRRVVSRVRVGDEWATSGRRD